MVGRCTEIEHDTHNNYHIFIALTGAQSNSKRVCSTPALLYDHAPLWGLTYFSMAKRIVFTSQADGTSEIQAYLNDKQLCFIQCGELNEVHSTGFVTLNEEDLAEFIKELQTILKDMKR